MSLPLSTGLVPGSCGPLHEHLEPTLDLFQLILPAILQLFFPLIVLAHLPLASHAHIVLFGLVGVYGHSGGLFLVLMLQVSLMVLFLDVVDLAEFVGEFCVGESEFVVDDVVLGFLRRKVGSGFGEQVVGTLMGAEL